MFSPFLGKIHHLAEEDQNAVGGARRIAHGAMKVLNITSRNAVDAFMSERRKNMIAQLDLSDQVRIIADY